MRLDKPVRLLLVAAGLAALAVLAWLAYDYVRVDSCLDAGGSWHHDEGRCDFEANYEA